MQPVYRYVSKTKFNQPQYLATAMSLSIDTTMQHCKVCNSVTKVWSSPMHIHGGCQCWCRVLVIGIVEPTWLGICKGGWGWVIHFWGLHFHSHLSFPCATCVCVYDCCVCGGGGIFVFRFIFVMDIGWCICGFHALSCLSSGANNPTLSIVGQWVSRKAPTSFVTHCNYFTCLYFLVHC